MIEAKNLSKQFGEVAAVNDLSLKVKDGSITGLLGPNGSGKTTTLRMLYTLMRPDSGKVLIDGIDASENPVDARRRLGVVPDSRGIYPRMTSAENLKYYGRLQGMEGDELEARVQGLSVQLGMEEIIDRRTEGFSQGQRVKVAIARAMMARPGNLLLDEPSNGLDVMSTRSLRQFLAAQKEEGRAVLLSTHIMQEVAALCDNIIVIARGRVCAEGSADELKEKTSEESLEDAFVKLIGSDEGLMA